MQDRFALRFENGERRGEKLLLGEGGVLTFGRRPGCSVQVVDTSVSGRHAELSIDPQGVLLRDLGSTNGTRVGGERISERRLAHGDEVLLGNVRLLFLDSQVGPDPPLGPAEETEEAGIIAAPAAPEASTSLGAAGETVRAIGADKMARSRARPVAALVALLATAVVGAGAWLWLGRAGARDTTRTVRPVEPVPGDLLAAGGSFEQDRGGWQGDERSPAGFEVDPAARRSGEVGLRAQLSAGEGAWALERSPLVRVPSGRSLRVQAWIAAEDGAEGQIGLELESSTGKAGPTWAWCEARGAGEGAEPRPLELTFDVPACYDQARALLLARLASGAEAGAVDADDVSLVPEPRPQARPRRDEKELYLGGSAAVLFEIDRAWLAEIALLEGPGAAADPAARRAQLACVDEENGFRLSGAASGTQEPRTLALFVEPVLAALRIATTGAGGYRTHQVEFDREQVGALLCGAGRDRAMIQFAAPVRVRGRPESGGFQIEAELGAADGVLLQLDFRAEVEAAESLAREARQAEAAGHPGAALSAWQQLFDRYPFGPELLSEAGTARARLEQAGLAEVRALRTEIERARFFRLVDLFRQCRAAAQGLAERFEGSGVAKEAQALGADVEGELAALERDLDGAERERLIAIERALRAEGSPTLADRVRERLNQRFGAQGSEGGGGR